MKTCIFVYEGFVHFEVMLTSLLMKKAGDVIVAGLDGNFVESYEGFTIKPDQSIADLKLSDLDLFIVPGGNPEEIYMNPVLLETLGKININKTVIAAICAGPLHLAKAGLLDGKKFTVDGPELEEYSDDFQNAIYIDQKVVRDGNIITAKPEGYIDLALEIGKVLHIFEDKDEYKQMAEFFKQ